MPLCHATNVVARDRRTAPFGATSPPQAKADRVCRTKNARARMGIANLFIIVGSSYWVYSTCLPTMTIEFAEKFPFFHALLSIILCLLMTNYQLKPPQNPLPYSSWQEAKEKRRKVLDTVRRRRAEVYKRFRERISGTLPEHHVRAEYALKSS